VKDIFEDDDVEGGLLVDAGNAFNVLAREATLWNSRILWPSGSRFLFRDFCLIHTGGLLEFLFVELMKLF